MELKYPMMVAMLGWDPKWLENFDMGTEDITEARDYNDACRDECHALLRMHAPEEKCAVERLEKRINDRDALAVELQQYWQELDFHYYGSQP